MLMPELFQILGVALMRLALGIHSNVSLGGQDRNQKVFVFVNVFRRAKLKFILKKLASVACVRLNIPLYFSKINRPEHIVADYTCALITGA